MGQVGEALTWVFPPRYFNGSLMDPGEFTMTLPSPSPDDLTAASVPVSSGNPYSAFDNRSDLASTSSQSIIAISDNMDDNNFSDFRSGWTDLRFLLQFASYSYPATGEIPQQHPLVRYLTNPSWIISLFAPVVALKVVVLLFKSVSHRTQYMRAVQLAGLEVLTFVKEIRAKKAALLMKFDEELSVADREVNEISARIKSERERICIELASLRIDALIKGEVKEVRKSFESRFQSEFERQTRLGWNRLNIDSSQGHHEFATQVMIKVQEDILNSERTPEPDQEPFVEEEQSQPQQQYLEQIEDHRENDRRKERQPTDGAKCSFKEK